MGWDPQNSRAVISEVEPADADRWAKDAEKLVELVKLCRIQSPAKVDGERNELAVDVILAPVRLARAAGVPLWSDDRAMRLLARSEGVEAFGTVSVLIALHELGALTQSELFAAQLEFLRQGYVDHNLDLDLLLRLADDEEWRGVKSGLVLSRPSTWIAPPIALELYRRGVSEAARRDIALLGQWAYAAALGAARRPTPGKNCAAVPVMLLAGLAGADMDSRAFPVLLAGVRTAAEFLHCPDPLTAASRLLAKSLRQSLSEADAAKGFTQITSELESGDRSAAFRTFLQAEA